MLRKLLYNSACALVVFAVAVTVIVRVEARQEPQQASPPAAATEAADAWARDQPNVMTKQQLFSQDHTADVLAIEQVWAAYGFFIDSGNGPAAASLYTPDAVIQHFWKDKDVTYQPHGGAGSFPTEYGTARGGPCIVRGRKQIEAYYGRETVKPQPGWGHHIAPNMLVKVSDDGKSAVLTSTLLTFSMDEKGVGRVGETGNYRNYFVKSPTEGWLIAKQYNMSEHPRGNEHCDANGPVATH
jgi:hypothetical protein